MIILYANRNQKQNQKYTHIPVLSECTNNAWYSASDTIINV